MTRQCPVNAISGELRAKHEIDPDRCIGCASCALICPDGCITAYRHSTIPNSLREELQKQ